MRFAFWRHGHRVRMTYSRAQLGPELIEGWVEQLDNTLTLKQAMELHEALGNAIGDLAKWERKNRKPDPREINA